MQDCFKEKEKQSSFAVRLQCWHGEEKQAVGSQSCMAKERVRIVILFKKEHNSAHSSQYHFIKVF